MRFVYSIRIYTGSKIIAWVWCIERSKTISIVSEILKNNTNIVQITIPNILHCISAFWWSFIFEAEKFYKNWNKIWNLDEITEIIIITHIIITHTITHIITHMIITHLGKCGPVTSDINSDVSTSLNTSASTNMV